MKKLPKAQSIGALKEQSFELLATNHGMDEISFIRWYSDRLTVLRSRQLSRTDPEKFRVIARTGYARNRAAYAEKARTFRKERKDDPVRLENYRAYCRRKMAERLKSDVNFRIRFRMRNRIWMSLQRGVATHGGTTDMLGCTIPEFKAYIESLWLPGMTWENYGREGWHIDHIKPCKAFNLTDMEQQKICFHHTNTQPLWEFDNLSKGARE